MPQKDPEKRKEYKRLWHLKNRKKILKKQKEYRIDNLERKKEMDKLYYINNCEKIKQKYIDNPNIKKEYYQTHNCKKSMRISKWRSRGVIDHFNDKYETLYRIYLSTKFCDECNVELNIEGDDRTRKCLDHEHKLGYFRNIICHTCNIRRG